MKLDLVQNKQKTIETYIESQILSADKSRQRDEITQIKQNFLNEVEQRKKLENDMAILVTGRNAEIEVLNNTTASLQKRLELFERENKTLREEIIRIKLINRSLEAMKTILLCYQKTSEVQKMNINNTNELQYTVSKPYTYESLIGVHQPCKDQLEEAGSLYVCLTRRM